MPRPGPQFLPFIRGASCVARHLWGRGTQVCGVAGATCVTPNCESARYPDSSGHTHWHHGPDFHRLVVARPASSAWRLFMVSRNAEVSNPYGCPSHGFQDRPRTIPGSHSLPRLPEPHGGWSGLPRGLLIDRGSSWNRTSRALIYSQRWHLASSTAARLHVSQRVAAVRIDPCAGDGRLLEGCI